MKRNMVANKYSGKIFPIVFFVLILSKSYAICPSVFVVSGSTQQCLNRITINNSQTGVAYELLVNSNPTGDINFGNTGSILTWWANQPGTYTVRATQSGCADVMMSGSYVSTLVPAVTSLNMTGGGSYCPDQGSSTIPVGLSASETGVTYTLLLNGGSSGKAPINGTGSAINWNNLPGGLYTIRGTKGTCNANMNGSVYVGIAPPPNNFQVTGGGNYCGGGAPRTVTLSSSQGYAINYQLTFQNANVGSPVAGTGGSLSWTNLTPPSSGVYRVVASRPACPSAPAMIMSTSASVTYLGTAPQVFVVGGTGDYCSGSPTRGTLTLSGSEPGIRYDVPGSSGPLQGTGSSLTWTNLVPGQYTVTAVNTSNTCNNSMSGNLQVNSVTPPTSFNFTGGGDFCLSTGGSFQLSGSQVGVTYQLFKEQTTAVGAPVTGTGNSLSWTGLTQAGNYSVLATKSVCQVWFGPRPISFNQTPTIFNVTGGGNICGSGGSSSIYLSSSDQPGLTRYQLKNGATNVGSLVPGSGSALSWSGLTTGGAYTVIAIKISGGCSQQMNSTPSATINASPLPTLFTVSGGGSSNYCGTGLSITLSGSESGINYQLIANGNNVGSPLAGSGSALTWTGQNISGTYTVMATNALTQCSQLMTGSASIVSTLPYPYAVQGGGNYCPGSSGVSVFLPGSEIGVNYQLVINGSNSGDAVSGTGFQLEWKNQVTTGVYTISATRVSRVCTNNMTGSVMVGINPLPLTTPTLSGGGNICPGGTGLPMTLSSSESGINYDLLLNGVTTGNKITGNGGALIWSNISSVGTYTVLALNPATACTSMMTGNASINFNPVPTIFSLSGGGVIPTASPGAAIILNGSETGTNYQLNLNNNSIGSIVSGTGSALTWPSLTGQGIYSIVATKTSDGCSQLMNGTPQVLTANANTLNVLNGLAFLYQYDTRHRMIAKKVPGADWVYMVYDNLDRIILTQDANLRATNKWQFTKYDLLNRPILTGIRDTSVVLTQAQMQSVVNAHFAKPSAAWGETFVGNIAGNVHGYSNKAYPVRTGSVANEVDPNKYLTVSYYDNYSFRSLWYGSYTYLNESLSETANSTVYNQPTTENQNVVGKSTGSKTKVLDGGTTGGYTWLKNVTYYDSKYRVIQTLADNYKGGTDRVTNVVDFVGKVLKSKTTHIEQDVAWTNLLHAMSSGNTLVDTYNFPNSSGASSIQQLPAGQDGWLEVTATETNTYRSIGFAAAHGSATNYMLAFQTNNALYISEGGGSPVSTSPKYYSGDIIRISRNGSVITYYVNGVLQYTSNTPSTTTLIVDVALGTPGCTVAGVRTSFSSSTVTIMRRFQYDHAGRLLKTFHQIGTNPEVLLAQNTYNELGQLVDKGLYSTDGGTTVKQSVDYRYNIRGWLQSMNNSQLTVNSTNNDDANDLFGMELGYNNSIGTGNTDNTTLYNGNISAVKWSSNHGTFLTGFGADVAYNYTYDAMNRITGASYLSNTNGAWTNAAGAFNESGYTYDLNGNIKSLLRKGSTGNVLDSMYYGYGSVGNQLLKVKDSGDKTKGFVDGANTGLDYTYDANGNLLTDQNKSLTAANAILYNYMNLPQQVTKSTNEKIIYTYDASGKKLMQQVYNTTGVLTKATDYDDEFIYRGDTLQFINHEEGRIVMKGVSTPEYQYHLKDHLGNVRLTFTTQTTTKTFTAGFETANQTTEAGNFSNYPNTSHINVVALNAHTGTNSLYLNGGTSGQVGLAKSLSVMPGDVVSIQAYGKYNSPTTSATNFTGFISSLLGAFNLTAPAPGEVGTPAAGVNNFGIWEIGATGDESKGDAVKMFVTIIMFDRNYNFLDVAYQAIQGSGSMNASYTAKQPGYAYLYVSNEHPYQADMYFDDVTVTFTPGPVVQMEDFYPFGLSFNEYTRENTVPQNFLYNDKERINDLAMDWYDYGARMYMPEIGRWGVVDPLSELSRRWSPYTYAYDNSIRFIDPDGMYSTDEWMQDHGLTQDDLQTTYSASEKNEEGEENESDNNGGGPGDEGKEKSGPLGPPSEKRDTQGNPIDEHGNYDDGHNRSRQVAALTWQTMGEITEEAWKNAALGEGLGLLGKGASALWQMLRLSSSAVRGLSVIGPRGTKATYEYVQYAESVGANYLKLGEGEVWTWAKNEKFLESVVGRGDDVAFAGKFDPTRLVSGTPLAREIGYLIDKGYEWTADFSKLIKIKK